MKISRRYFLRTLFRIAGLVSAQGVLAALRPGDVPPEALSGAEFQSVLTGALGGASWNLDDRVAIEVPLQAENGAMVPVTVESRLPRTTRILVLAEKNPRPVLAEFTFLPGADPWVALRVKLNASGKVLAIAESGGRFYGTETRVEVMTGGCG